MFVVLKKGKTEILVLAHEVATFKLEVFKAFLQNFILTQLRSQDKLSLRAARGLK